MQSNTNNTPPGTPAFLNGGGGTGALMRAHDWSACALGAPAAWPQSLKTLVGVMLAANQAMFVAWGPKRVMLYNDAYAEMLGAKHPAALGRPFSEVWFELADSVGPIMDRAFAGEPTRMDDIELVMVRNGYPETTHFSFFYAPVRTDACDGQGEARVEGVYGACVEITEKVFAERRAAFRTALEARLRELADPAMITAAASEMLGRQLGVAQVGYSEIDDGGEWLVVARDWSDGRISSVAGRHRLDGFGHALPAKLRAGEFIALADVRDEAGLPDPRAVAAFEALSIRAALVVPLVKDGRLVATLFVHDAQVRNWSRLEMDLARDVAERTWAAVERRRAEAARREGEARFRAVLEQMPIGVTIAGVPSGERIFFNTRAAELLGHGLTGPTGPGDWRSNALHPDGAPYRPQDYPILRAVLHGERVEREPMRYRRGDGSIAHLEVGAAPIHDSDGRAVLAVCAFDDVSERRYAEKCLREERDRARSYLKVAGVMLLVLDTEGRIETINRRGAEILGHADEAALVGRDWIELAIPPARRAEVRAVFEQLLSAQTSASGASGAYEAYENPVLRADGSERLIAWRNTVLRDGDGRITGTLSSGEDVTEARRAQALLARDKAELERLVGERTAQLVQAQKMEAIGLLTGGVAHDFNNLLQSLGSCLYVLDRHVPEGDPRALFEAAQQSIERGARLTQALLAFARRQTLVPQPIALRELFDDIGPLLERTLGGLIRIAVEVAPGTPPALVDRAQLESAILNLVINARDAMPCGGTLTLRADAATLAPGAAADHPRELEPGEYVTVSVEDSGCGMDEATLARAFEPFFTTKEFGKGSGLGLSMVHGMAAQSGGGVCIASKLARGTTVTLYLPRARQAAADSAPEPMGAGGGDGGTVLLVDDNDLVRTAIQMTLEALGYRVLAASGGEAALKILQGGQEIDALITDYAMPGMNGAELTREARRLVPALPVLQITGYADKPAELADALILHKPFRSEELVSTLAALLRNESPGGLNGPRRSARRRDSAEAGRSDAASRVSLQPDG